MPRAGQRRRQVLATTIAVAVICPSCWKRTGTAPAAPAVTPSTRSAAGPSRVRGLVVHDWQGGDETAGDCTVAIAGRSTTTAADGTFVLDGIPSTYDAYVTDGSGETVSVHYGLQRRDPVLRHTKNHNPGSRIGVIEPSFKTPSVLLGHNHGIEVCVLLSNGGTSWCGPLDPPFRQVVRWHGPVEVQARLLALAYTIDPNSALSSRRLTAAAAASRTLRVADKETKPVELELRPVPVGHLAGTVETIPGSWVGQIGIAQRLPSSEQLFFSRSYDGFRLFPGESVGPRRFDIAVPDLRSIGATNCISVTSATSTVARDWVMRCGVETGAAALAFRLLASPQITRPSTGSLVNRETVFTWPKTAGGIYVLKLDSVYHFKKDRPEGPQIIAYTSSSELRWPDLSAIGRTIPAGTKYKCTLETRVSFASIDTFAARDLAIPDRTDTHRLTSEEIEVTLAR